MRTYSLLIALTVLLPCAAFAQSKAPHSNAAAPSPAAATLNPEVKSILEQRVKTEWEAFKNRDMKAYTALLADDFVGIEDDGEGARNRYVAAHEVERSLVDNYALAFFKAVSLGPSAALATYEITMQFPRTAQIRFKRIYVSELWIAHNGEWVVKHYQETRVR